jgi:hypothetical protein
VDFPQNTKFFVEGNTVEINSGNIPAEALLVPLYKTHIITSVDLSRQ